MKSKEDDGLRVFGAYEEWLVEQFARLLDASPGDERVVHEFLEQHPCLLPGGGGLGSLGAHHGPFPGAVISKPQLSGTFSREPDFMWMTKNTGECHPVLVEIEAPGKPWFVKSGQMAEPLNQAVTQLAEWRDWLDHEGNRSVFYETFRISDRMRRSLVVRPRFVLIYGRRREFESDPERMRRSQQLKPEWLEWMTYDRLSPDYKARNWVTVRYLEGEWRVVAVPPTFNPERDGTMEDLGPFKGLAEAIRRNPLLSDSYKEDLVAASERGRASGFPRLEIDWYN